MPLPINFDSILDGNKVESERVEFKETWDPQASLKTICAFANDLNNWGGGYLVIGVHETESGIKELIGVSPEDADIMLPVLHGFRKKTPKATSSAIEFAPA